MLRSTTSLLCVAGLAGSAAASTVFYDNNVGFKAALGSSTVLESFETVVSSTGSTSAVYPTGVVSSVNNNTLNDSATAFQTDGLRSTTFLNDNATTSFLITFPVPVIGFALDIIDLQTAGTPSVFLSTTGGDEDPVAFALTNQSGGNVLNYGVIPDSPVTSVRFEFGDIGAAGAGDVVAFDSLEFAAVPSPAAAGGGLAMLTLVGLRRRGG